MELLENYLKKDSKKFYLNGAHSRSLQVCLASIYPIKLVIRLTAHDYEKCYIDLTFELWEQLLEKHRNISWEVEYEKEVLFITTDELKIFTQVRHGTGAACFMNFTGQRVNMRHKTFEQLKKISKKVTSFYIEYNNKIQATAEFLSSFIKSLNQQDVKDLKEENNPLLTDVLNKLQNLPIIEFIDSTWKYKRSDKDEMYFNVSHCESETDDDYYEEREPLCKSHCNRCCGRYRSSDEEL